MSVSCDLSATPSAPQHGQTVVVAYSVTGNDGTPAQGATISGRVVVGGQEFDVSTSITLPAVPPDDVTYDTPTCEGLTFVATADPSAFTAVVP